MTIVCKKCGKKVLDFSLAKTSYICAKCEKKQLSTKLKNIAKNFGI